MRRGRARRGVVPERHWLQPLVQSKKAVKRRREDHVDSSRALKRLRATQASLGLALEEDEFVLGNGAAAARDAGRRAAAPEVARSIHPAAVENWPAVQVLRTRQRAKSAPPMALPPAVVAALREATLGGQVAALPLFKVDKRTAARPLAESSVRERFRKWYESEAGQKWRRERVELHHPEVVLARLSIEIPQQMSTRGARASPPCSPI